MDYLNRTKKESTMIAITGATGNIGSKITADLLAKGQTVRCIARTADNLKTLAAKGADIAAVPLEDTAALANAFAGVDAVFAMIPPHYQAPDFRSYQNAIGSSIAAAVETSGVKYVVNLSSQGAQLPDKTGLIKGLYDQEQRLNKLKGINILHLRPTYFMENLLANIDMIKQMNIMGSAIQGGMKIPMIATQDIAKFAAERLIKKDFAGMPVKDLLGQRDLSMSEAAEIIGRKIDMPGLRYVQFSYEDTEKALADMGFSADVARLFIEMSKAFNNGLINTPRTRENTTKTSFEDFAAMFAKIFFA
jgi:uncharacterized protein YbjT (DUF2867 family)